MSGKIPAAYVMGPKVHSISAPNWCGPRDPGWPQCRRNRERANVLSSLQASNDSKRDWARGASARIEQCITDRELLVNNLQDEIARAMTAVPRGRQRTVEGII